MEMVICIISYDRFFAWFLAIENIFTFAVAKKIALLECYFQSLKICSEIVSEIDFCCD
jgi:hypothetical protein